MPALRYLLDRRILQYRFAREAWKDWQIVQRFDADSHKPSRGRD